MQPADYVPISIALRMTARLRATHTRQSISVFSGPPGLGKTTAIEQFAAEFPGAVAIVKIATQGVREVGAMQHCLEAMEQITDTRSYGRPAQGAFDSRHSLSSAIGLWAGRRTMQLGGGANTPAGPLTFVFDEAQNLSRNAIESLRYWNDRDRCYGPFPIGLVFVGNNEFALKDNKAGDSQISAAVADRALFVERYDYTDLTNADLRLFLTSKGIDDPAAVDAILKHYSTPRAPRSLRQVTRLANALVDEAGGTSVTSAHVWGLLDAAA